jgi:hypothetical protein
MTVVVAVSRTTSVLAGRSVVDVYFLYMSLDGRSFDLTRVDSVVNAHRALGI